MSEIIPLGKSTTDITENDKLSFHGGTIAHHANYLLGRILTITDASITDPVQRKAIKDMVKTEFYNFEFNLKRDESIKILEFSTSLGEIFRYNSRGLDEDVDFDASGRVKHDSMS
jgi:hypothetical protein